MVSSRNHPSDAAQQRTARIHETVNDCLLRRSAGKVITDESRPFS